MSQISFLNLGHQRVPQTPSRIAAETHPTADAPAATRRVVLLAAFALLLGTTSVAAQNAPTPKRVPTGDDVRYGAHSPSACPRPKGSHASSAVMPANCLTRRERKVARQHYQTAHRSEFPSVYQPGVQ